MADEFEKKLSANLRQRDEAEFVDDEEFHRRHLLLQAQEALLVPCFDEFVNDGRGCGEAGFDPSLAGGETDAEGDMSLADLRWTESDEVLPPPDKLSRRQIEHQLLVESRNGVEVEAFQTFDRWELRRLDPAIDHLRFAIQELQFNQASKVTDMVNILCGALAGDLLMFAQHCWQL